MYWHAEKSNGEIVVLTEREALIHFEKNNVSTRMRLRFIGTSSGKHQADAKNQVVQLIDSHRPENYAMLSEEEKKVCDYNIRLEHIDEVKEILEEAGKKEFEEAKENGVKSPDKSLHVHTRSTDGHSREEILQSAKGMVR